MNVNNSYDDQIITMVDLFSGKLTVHRKKDWIFHFAQEYKIYGRLSCIPNLYGLQMTESDTFSRRKNDSGEYQYSYRPYLFYDEDERIIDPRIWSTEILNLVYNKKNWEAAMRSHCLLGEKETIYALFRKGPVPHTGKPSAMAMHRNPCVGNAIRQGSNPEYQEFIRNSRNANVLQYETHEVCRVHSRSWKDNTKCRHQWQKKIVRRNNKNAIWVKKDTWRKAPVS